MEVQFDDSINLLGLFIYMIDPKVAVSLWGSIPLWMTTSWKLHHRASLSVNLSFFFTYPNILQDDVHWGRTEQKVIAATLAKAPVTPPCLFSSIYYSFLTIT